MKFGETVREARLRAGMSQTALAESVGVSLRTVQNYENGGRYPKKREIYTKLASVLHTDVNTFLTEDDAFIDEARARYGARGERQAQELLTELNGLFSGGDLAEEDMDEMMRAIQDAYWIAKEKNRKYAGDKRQSEK